MALLTRITSDPAWRLRQEQEESRKLAAFAVRLLAWHGQSEELPNHPSDCPPD